MSPISVVMLVEDDSSVVVIESVVGEGSGY